MEERTGASSKGVLPPAEAAEPAASLNLEKLVPYRLTVLSNSLGASAMRLYGGAFGLRSVTEWPIIAALGHQAPLTAIDIAKSSMFEKTRVARAVQRLISVNLVVAKEDPSDARKSLLWLTESGARLHDEIVPYAMLRNEISTATLDDAERRQLDHLLEKLNKQLAAVEGVSRGSADDRT
ncbi:MAG: MarR family winged helix-turn-helix transcriptional regulator [Pseudomonadota bacterium]